MIESLIYTVYFLRLKAEIGIKDEPELTDPFNLLMS